MRVEVWSDIVCPWCYLGKRRLEKALAGFEHAGDVEVEWRSFQLDPSFPKGLGQPVYEALARKTGATAAQVRGMTEHVKALAAEEGLAYDFDRSVMANTFDAHRLTHLAKTHGIGAEMHERLMRANLVEGEVVDDAETLVRLGAEVGVPAGEARRVLAGDAYSREVMEDVNQARALGATGVPFFVLDRTYGISGAQPVEAFLGALRTAREHAATRAG
ncbi:DsbA family oxidoreductase [Sphaerisporangium sp. TRM90804]|uniref:DsbA family oxidoreductase n=1 Tax=Sphaerisporangium sp. TRM90804 TaxID=3031113 RepID=UPI00244A7978|nr:DsbA family oxidoreductase [Sphaerisporangium sp. TRM90804]MDH2427026.1 DsbA family oxidoreductase [Sphaerisporangium sp. TRM90804]